MTAEIWADCIDFPCSHCGAEPKALCTFSVNGHTFCRHCPCNARLVAADKAAGSSQ